MVSITQTLENWTLPHRLWKTGAPLPTPLLESATTVIDNQLYVFGGFTFRWQATKDIYAYNLEADQWTKLGEMPTPVTHVNAVLDESRVWFAGGFVGNHPGATTEQVWRYDSKDNSWTEGIPLPQPRAGGGLQIINGELHYFGGFAADRDTTCGEHWALPLEGGTEWVEKAPLPNPKGHVSSITVGEKIYAIGGQQRHDTNPIDVNSVHVYDSVKDTWLELASLPEPRSHFEPSTFALDDYIVIIGGRNNQNRHLLSEKLTDIFDHKNDKLIDDFPLQVFLALKYSIKGSKYYTNLLPKITIYDIKLDTWSELASLPTHLYAPVANVISKWLVISGGGRIRHINVQSRTLLNQSLIDIIKTKSRE
ncbi:MAG: kelch repeat-containing protein [Spirulinaceae cyanobacterium]